MKSQLAQTEKGPIEYTLLGAGPIVLVCHGTSSDCYSTAITGRLPESGFSVLTPSRPGYGSTPLEVGPSTEAAALGLVALLDALEIETCSLIAISGGGPTGIALAANHPQRVRRLVLAVAISNPTDRRNEPSYQQQMTFYGSAHNLMWGMFGLIARLSPRAMARQTMATFSTHDPDDALKQLSAADLQDISRFYRGRSSRQGALNDFTHALGSEALGSIHQPTLVIHSREDRAVPFSQAKWSLAHLPQAELCEAGCTGHFFWVGPDFARIEQRLISFLRETALQEVPPTPQPLPEPVA